MRRSDIRCEQGFTLIELLVTMSLVAVILTLGIPSFETLLRDVRLATQANSFLTALSLARSEAVKRSAQVVICKADLTKNPPVCDTSKCDTTSGASCWEKGWLVFYDHPEEDGNPDGKFTAGNQDPPCLSEQEDCLIRVFEALPSGFTLRTGDNLALWVSYLGDGRVKGSGPKGNGGLGNDSFRLCKTHSDNKVALDSARRIVISGTGRARIEKGLDGKDSNTCP